MIANAGLTARGHGVAVLMTYPRARALDHPTRRRIYDHLLALPGDHFRSIMRGLGLSLGTCRYHLDVLVACGHLLKVRSGSRSRFYPNGRDVMPGSNQRFAEQWADRDSRLRILFALARSAPSRVSALARDLRMSRQLVAYHLSRLEEAGYVRRDGQEYVAIARLHSAPWEGPSRDRNLRAGGEPGAVLPR